MKITRLARRNAAQNKSIILMVTLCCMLIGTVVNMGFAAEQSVRDNLVALYGENHVTLTGVTEEQIDFLSGRPEVALMDVRRSLPVLVEVPGGEDKSITLTYASGMGISEALPLTAGRAPEKETEAVIAPYVAELLGIEAKLGEEFTVDCYPWNENGEADPSRKETLFFTVSGLLRQENYSRAFGNYPIYISEALAKDSNAYPLVLLTMKGSDPRGAAETVCNAAGIHPQYRVYNEMILNMSTVDPAAVAFIIVIVLILCAAGALVVYNAYNLSTEKRIHQYGLLILLGASKKQIRFCVCIEAAWAVLFGLPFGLLASALAGLGSMELMRGMVNTDLRFSLSPVALALSAFVTLVTVLFGASRPARRASKVAPVEAVRFAAAPDQTRCRETLENVTPAALAKLNMSRKRRRFAGIVASLTLGGVLFLGIATVAVSMLASAGNLAEQMTTGDMSITLSSDRVTYNADGTILSVTDTLTPALAESILAVDGVEQAEPVAIQRLSDTQTVAGKSYSYYKGAVCGLSPESLQGVMDAVYEGSPVLADFDDLRAVIAVLPSAASIETYRSYDVGIDEILADYTLGAELEMPLDTRIPEDEVKRIKLKIVGLVSTDEIPNYSHISSYYPDLYTLSDSFAANGFDSRTKRLILTLEDGKEQTAEEAVRALCAAESSLEVESFVAVKAEVTRQILGITMLIFAVLAVVALIGFLNLVGSIFMGVEQRKRELGILMAIGLSRKGVGKMLTREGVWVSVFCTLLSAAAGLGLGVGLYRFLILQGADYMSFTFPLWPLITLIAVYGLVPFGITLTAVRRLRRFTTVELLGRQT